MKKNKIFFYALLATAFSFTFTACDDDDDNDSEKATFEDVTLGTDGYWKGDSTSVEGVAGAYGTNYNGSFSSKGITFSNTFTTSAYGTSWSGFAVSSLADTSVAGDYTNDLYVYSQSGAGNSRQFAVAFSDGAQFSFENPVNLESVMLANTTYAYKVIKNGNAYSTAFSTGSWFKVTFIGYDDKDNKVGETDYYLADYRDGKTFINGNWEKVDLSALKKVKTVKLKFDGSDSGDWGLNTPAYVAIDNIEFND